MDIYISTLINKDLDKAIKIIKSLNANIEISNFYNCSPYEKQTDELTKHISKELSGFENKIILHSIACGFFDKDFILKNDIDKNLKSIEIAKILNAHKIVFHTGYNPQNSSSAYRNKFIKNHINFWKTAINELEKANIIATLENTFEPDPNINYEIVKKVNSPWLKICIDTGHINIQKQICFTKWIETVIDETSHFHLHNNYGKKDEHNSLTKGTINISELIRYLRYKKSTTSLTIEIEGEEKAIESYQYLKNLLIKENGIVTN